MRGAAMSARVMGIEISDLIDVLADLKVAEAALELRDKHAAERDRYCVLVEGQLANARKANEFLREKVRELEYQAKLHQASMKALASQVPGARCIRKHPKGKAVRT
jgi:hypothetical protein